MSSLPEGIPAPFPVGPEADEAELTHALAHLLVARYLFRKINRVKNMYGIIEK